LRLLADAVGTLSQKWLDEPYLRLFDYYLRAQSEASARGYCQKGTGFSDVPASRWRQPDARRQPPFDFLLGQFDRHGFSAITSFAGPTYAQIDTVMEILHGEGDSAHN
jgi:hypothetical protein